MTDQEFLRKIESDCVDVAEHLANESEEEIRKKGFNNLGVRKLESLEDDVWKRVLHVDEKMEVVRKRINEIYYYDEREMPTSNKLGMVAALLEYEQRIMDARRRLTDNVIRTIQERLNALLRVNLVRRGGAEDLKE